MTEFFNYYRIDSYDTPIEEGWYKVVLRVGFYDENGNGIFDDNEFCDYHWWYETSTGEWADKPGKTPSKLHIGSQGIDPAASPWTVSDLSGFSYNSEPIYYRVRDVRNYNW